MSANTHKIKIDQQYNLTELQEKDVKQFVYLFDNPNLHKNLTTGSLLPYNDAKFYTYLNGIKEQTKEHGSLLTFAIRDTTETIVGTIGFTKFDKRHKVGEISYWLGEEFWGHGIMPKSIRAICQYGFNELGLHRIQAKVLLNNQASKNTLNKVGFQLEGVLRDYCFIDNHFVNAKIFSLLKPELR